MIRHKRLINKEEEGRELVILLPHLKWRGTRLPQVLRSKMVLLMSTREANLGVIEGQIHSKCWTLIRWQHAGDGGCPYTIGLHAFSPSRLSSLHWLGLNPSPLTLFTLPSITIININTHATRDIINEDQRLFFFFIEPMTFSMSMYDLSGRVFHSKQTHHPC